MNDNYWWELTIKSTGEVVPLGPVTGARVKAQMPKGGHLIFKTRTIAITKDIDIQMTGRKFEPRLALPAGTSDTGLIEDVAKAFNEPITRDDGKTVMAKWVKRAVSRAEYNKFYANHPSYRKLDELHGLINIAYRVAINNIDGSKTVECDDNETNRLERMIA